MKASPTTPATIDEYIAGFPRDVQAILKKIRTTIRKAAPGAEERISYQIPSFSLDGNLVHFAAFKNHIGMYPAPRGNVALDKKLAPYRAGKATIRFSLAEPVPYALIETIVKFRVKENRERAKKKGKKKQ